MPSTYTISNESSNIFIIAKQLILVCVSRSAIEMSKITNVFDLLDIILLGFKSIGTKLPIFNQNFICRLNTIDSRYKNAIGRDAASGFIANYLADKEEITTYSRVFNKEANRFRDAARVVALNLACNANGLVEGGQECSY